MEFYLRDILGLRRFTPYGILQNTEHVWPKNPSGVVRSLDALKFGWLVNFNWFITPKNAIYVASLGIGFRINSKLLYGQKSFIENNVKLWSDYHTKNCIRQCFTYNGLHASCSFILLNGNTIACKIEIKNPLDIAKDVAVFAVAELKYPNRKLYLNPKYPYIEIYLDGLDDYGRSLRLILGGNLNPDILSSIRRPSEIGEQLGKYGIQYRVESRNYVGGIALKRISIAPRSTAAVIYVLHRCSFDEEYEAKLNRFISSFEEKLAAKISEDASFWRNCALIFGDWPSSWINGFIYDVETLRMIIYPPVGVFKHKWDVMHVNWPRNVVAETSLDMLILGHVYPDLAKEVIYGLYSDAVAPNVPCIHADGTYNMVARDGSKCGTSLAWCLPFYCYILLYELTGDIGWLKSIYPYWRNFLIWWLKNRTDNEGFLHYKCSWESGEDCAPRFEIKNCIGDESIEHIRTVELQACMAYAAKTMEYYSRILNLDEDTYFWRRIVNEYELKLQKLWRSDWFHDYNTEVGDYTRYTDPLHLTPIFMDLIDVDRGIKFMSNPDTLLEKFKESVGVNTLDWPSLIFPFFEALLKAGEFNDNCREYLVSKIHDLLSIAYSAMDRSTLEKNRPLPGVSYEKWEWPEIKFGGVEGYGWGAFTTLALIRYILGFQSVPFSRDIKLYPGFSEKLMENGREYGIRNLQYRNLTLDLKYKVTSPRTLRLTLKVTTEKKREIHIVDSEGNFIASKTLSPRIDRLSTEIRNNEAYILRL